MRDVMKPALHLFVCANRRDGSPLGPGCSERGDAVYDALKREVAARGMTREAWVTKTHCLGICPAAGATIASYPPRPGHGPIETEVEPADAAQLLAARAVAADPGEAPVPAAAAIEPAELARLMGDLEELQRKKVLDLARRLKPGLTLEDVQNPHDFPELDDPDWHYADGVLSGIASVKTALAARMSEARARPAFGANLEPDVDEDTRDAGALNEPRSTGQRQDDG